MYFKLSGCKASEIILNIPVARLSVSNVRNSDMMCVIVKGMPQLEKIVTGNFSNITDFLWSSRCLESHLKWQLLVRNSIIRISFNHFLHNIMFITFLVFHHLL
jgi:hypothetical protein